MSNYQGGIIADTPEAIHLMGLIVLKGDLKLLSKGIGRKGYNARTLAKQVTGLKTNNIDKLMEAVEKKIEEASKDDRSRFKPI